MPEPGAPLNRRPDVRQGLTWAAYTPGWGVALLEEAGDACAECGESRAPACTTPPRWRQGRPGTADWSLDTSRGGEGSWSDASS